MPYIVTTHRYLDDPTAEFREGAAPAITRTAVATLEEARQHVRDFCDDRYAYYGRYHADADCITESGGTVGPLPDGTVIDVERVDWMDFERQVVPGPVAAHVPITTFDDDSYRAALLDAFNAR